MSFQKYKIINDEKKGFEGNMAKFKHTVERAAVGKVIDTAVKKIGKDQKKELSKIMDMIKNYWADEKIDVNYDEIKEIMTDSDTALYQYLSRLFQELDSKVIRTTFQNLGFEAFVCGTTKRIAMQYPLADSNGSDQCM